MCFMLYAGTAQPLPRRAWNLESPTQLSVEPLTGHDAAVKAHFQKPEVQNIGSTSNCGCDFPHTLMQNGDWYHFDELNDAEQVASEQLNMQALAGILRESADRCVELYGVWDGDFDEGPAVSEELSLAQLLKPGFRFKEKGFYRVTL